MEHAHAPPDSCSPGPYITLRTISVLCCSSDHYQPSDQAGSYPILPSLRPNPTLASASSLVANHIFPTSCLLYPRFEISASRQINALLDAILPNAIALTDAWDFSDASLASALGCKDGNVYERLMSWTRQLPINARAKEESGFDTRESWER